MARAVAAQVGAIFVGLLLIVPIRAGAQSDELRQYIRADLEAAPSSVELSDAELHVLVEELATEAERNGEAERFLAARNTTDFSSAFAADSSAMPSKAFWLALCALVVLVVSLIWYRRRQLASE